MKPTDRNNGLAAAREIARMRRIEKMAFGVWLAVVALVGLVAFFRYDKEAFLLVFPIFAVVTLLPVLLLLRPQCPFCGVALTRNFQGRTGTLFLPKCLKCGVPFDAPTDKESTN